MTCKICGRQACTESFHSLKEQEEFETKTGRYEPDEEWMNAPLGTPDLEIDSDYEQAKADKQIEFTDA